MDDTKLFVRNLSFATVDAELLELFGQFGEVVSAKVALERDTGRGRGFAFVEMATAQGASDAIQALNGRDLGGREIQVAMSEPRERGSNKRNR